MHYAEKWSLLRHVKLRVPVGDISDWLVNADVSGFCHPYRAGEVATPMYSARKMAHFRIFHDFLLPPTTFCCLPRLSAASYDYLLPPSLRPHGEIPETPCPGLLLRRGDRIKGTMNA
jgi:hypothetical protein